jgi:hypothetical protein
MGHSAAEASNAQSCRFDNSALPIATMNESSSQSRPNMVGIVANLKTNKLKGKSRVQKMPAFDRNYETLSAEDLEKFKRQMQ